MKRLTLITFAVAVLCLGLTGYAVAEIECDRECLAGFMDTYLQTEAVLTTVPYGMESGW